MNATELSSLNGRSVLVCSARDHRNPPTGRRGTLIVHEQPVGHSIVEVEVELPQMFTTKAKTRRIRLSDAEIGQMLASEDYGALTVVIEDWLDPEAPESGE